jgi:hypothetical protein
MATTDITEKGLESLIVAALTGHSDQACASRKCISMTWVPLLQ